MVAAHAACGRTCEERGQASTETYLEEVLQRVGLLGGDAGEGTASANLRTASSNCGRSACHTMHCSKRSQRSKNSGTSVLVILCERIRRLGIFPITEGNIVMTTHHTSLAIATVAGPIVVLPKNAHMQKLLRALIVPVAFAALSSGAGAESPNKAAALRWPGYIDTDLSFSDSSGFTKSHTIVAWFMPQYLRGYSGPIVTVNEGGAVRAV